jgi:hypothetical protein
VLDRRWPTELDRTRPPAHPARQNVLPIHTLPRHIERLPGADALAWVVAATELTLYQVLTGPHLVRERLLAAVTRERLAARKRRMAILTSRRT